MPSSVNIIIKNVSYSTPILNGDMQNIADEIQSKKQEIETFNQRLANAINELNELNKQFMAMYIQQTGSFP